MDNWKLECPNGHSAVVELEMKKDIILNHSGKQFLAHYMEIFGGCENMDCSYRRIPQTRSNKIQIGNDENW